VKTCNEPFKAQAVFNLLYCLQSIKSNSLEVIVLLVELPRLVKICIEPLKALAVFNLLCGLQGMKSDCPEVIALFNT
jgi:hypothetical protein